MERNIIGDLLILKQMNIKLNFSELAGIYDMDVVVVDRDAKPTSGRIVIAVVDGGFVVRQLMIREGVPVLEARNSSMRYEPVVADESVEVWGVVRASVRNLQRA